MAVNDPMSNGTRSAQTNQSTTPMNRAGQTAPSASGTAGGAGQSGQSAKDVAGQVASQAQQQASQMVDQVKQQGKSQLSTQKTNVAHSIESVAQAADQFSQQLRQSNQAPVAGYVTQASGQLRRVSSYLNDTDLADIFDDAEGLARQQPVLFIGGAFLLGALAARFLKSSAQQSRSSGMSANGPSRNRAGYQPGYRTGYRPGYQGGPANGQFTGNIGAQRRMNDRPYQRDNGTSLGYYDPGTTGDNERDVHF